MATIEKTVSTAPRYRSKVVCGDWIMDQSKGYQAFTSGQLWNGWECPYFTFEVARQLAQDMPGLQYDPATDEFVREDHCGPEYESLELGFPRFHGHTVKLA